MSGSASFGKSATEPTIFSLPSETENRVSRVFRGPPERVFRLFTDRATLPYIFSPDPAKVMVETFEFTKGGRYSIRVQQDDGSTTRIHGEFLEIDPPRKVVNTFAANESPETAIETDVFEPEGEFTRLTVTWKFKTRKERDQMAGPRSEAALTAMWDHFEEILSGGIPGRVSARA